MPFLEKRIGVRKTGTWGIGYVPFISVEGLDPEDMAAGLLFVCFRQSLPSSSSRLP